MPVLEGKCTSCPTFLLRKRDRGNQQLQTRESSVAGLTEVNREGLPHNALAAEAGASVLFPNAEIIRSCPRCQEGLSKRFDMPQFWWKHYCKNANGYFGYHDVWDASGEWDGTVTWCRVIVKRFQSIAESKLWYDWPKLNVVSRWYPKTKHTCTIIFDPPAFLRDTLASCLLDDFTEAELADPFWVYPRLIGEFVNLQDCSVWDTRIMIRDRERKREFETNPQPDYAYLHDVARHVIHVSETLKVTIHTVKSIQQQMQRFQETRAHLLLSLSPSAAPMQETNIANDLHFYHHMLDSLYNRSESNRARLQNEVSLAFNTVANHDSRIAVQVARDTQRDSTAMRTISVVTLLFLPATFVSAIFSTSFFNFNADSGVWSVSNHFWIYWATSIPVTVLSLVAWWVWPSISGDGQKKIT